MRRKGTPFDAKSAETDDSLFKLPPRSNKHPSNRGKLIKIFYTTLLILFTLLAAGLTVWGKYRVE